MEEINDIDEDEHQHKGSRKASGSPIKNQASSKLKPNIRSNKF